MYQNLFIDKAWITVSTYEYVNEKTDKIVIHTFPVDAIFGFWDGIYGGKPCCTIKLVRGNVVDHVHATATREEVLNCILGKPVNEKQKD